MRLLTVLISITRNEIIKVNPPSSNGNEADRTMLAGVEIAGCTS
jgi:hypothetical protein